MILFYVPCENNKQAKEIANTLLQKKLIVCANMAPVTSLYMWKGKVAQDSETVLILKTIDQYAKKVEKEIEKMHSYGVPVIIQLKAKVNKAFEEWIIQELT